MERGLESIQRCGSSVTSLKLVYENSDKSERSGLKAEKEKINQRLILETIEAYSSAKKR